MAKTILGKVGMTPKGNYSNTTNYVRLDVVTVNGSSYVCLKDCVGKAVTDTEYWQLVAEKGDKGDKPVTGIDYNTDAEKKEFKNDVVTETKTDIADYVTEQKTELNTHTETKKSELDEYESTKETELNTKATKLTNAFNTNATSKTKDYNDNATAKTTDFDNNATEKTTAYNDNATAKLEAYNTNATQKLEEYNENATNKVTEFNNNVDSIENELTELAKQMPWNTTEIQDSIHIEDSAKYSRNKLDLFGNLMQETRKGKNLIDFSNFESKSKNLSYTFQNDILTVMQNGKNSYASVNFNVLSILKNNPSKKIKFVYEKLDLTNFTSPNKVIVQILTTENGTQKYYILANTEGTKYSYTIPDNVTNITNALLKIYTNSSDDDTVSTSGVTIIKPMLIFADIADETYEKYGVMPSVDYPSMPQTATGVQKITKVGKNYWSAKFNFEENGLKVTTDSSGLITVNGTPTQNITKHFIANKKIRYGKYIISVDRNLSNYKMLITIRNKENFLPFSNGLQTLSGVKTNVNITNTMYYQSIIFYEGYTYNNVQFRIQLEEGDSATEFEPYQEEKINLDLGDTELCKITDSKGNVVAQDGIVYRENKWQFEKNIQKHIVDKSKLKQAFTHISNKFRYEYTDLKNAVDSSSTTYPAVCNIFKLCVNGQTYAGKKGFTISSGHLYLYNDGETLADFLTKIENIDIVITYITTEPIYEDCTPEQSEVLNRLYKLNLQQGVNNIFVESENGVTIELQLEYMQNLNSKLNQLEAMIVSNASGEVTQ